MTVLRRSRSNSPLEPAGDATLASALLLLTAWAGTACTPEPAALPPALALARSEASVEAETSQIRQRMEQGEWAEAQREILALLEEHGDVPAVRARLHELRRDYRSATLRRAVSPPRPQDLVSGELTAWDPVTGRAQLHYGPGDRADFRFEDGVHVHPLATTGPYHLVLRGHALPNAPSAMPEVLLGIGAAGNYVLQLGGIRGDGGPSAPARLVRFEGDREWDVAEAWDGLAVAGKPFEFALGVDATSLTLRLDGETVLETPIAPGSCFGAFGLTAFESIEEIEFRGEIHSSWLRGLVEAETRRQQDRWRVQNDPFGGFPEWARAAPLDLAERLDTEDPSSSATFFEIQDLLLRDDRIDLVREAVRERRADPRAVADPRFQALECALVDAERGPDLFPSFVEETEHYRVVTDLDARVATAAAAELEGARSRLVALLGEPPPRDRRVPAFLFAGRARYQSYVDEVSAEYSTDADGGYCPTLKQLLVGSLPDQPSIDATLRHEATHQFLDQKGVTLPAWMEEGYAEYVSALRTSEGGEVEVGAWRPEWFDELRRLQPLPKLADLVQLDAAYFDAGHEVHYPLAWAFVYFLHQDSERWPFLKERVLSLLRRPCRASQFQRALFEGVDLEELDADFRSFLRARGL